MPFSAPESDLLPAGAPTTAFGDPVLGATPASGRQARDIADAIIAGLQNSATGLAVRGKLPSMVLGESAPWYHRLAANAAGIVADVPAMVPGAIAGAPAGPLGMAAGSFAAPMALREGLIAAYNNNHALSWQGAADIAFAALKGGAKGAVIGAATAGAGRAVAPLVEGAVAKGVATTGAELAALTATSAAISQHMPTWQDFMDNAILLGGMKGAVAVAKGLRNNYAETGKTPAEQLADAAKDPELKAALEGKDPKLEALRAAMRDIEALGERHKNDLTYQMEVRSGDMDRALARVVDKYGAELKPETKDVLFPRYAKDWETGEAIQAADSVRGTHIFDLREEIFQRDLDKIPESYRPLVLEERIKAAVDADPRPEMIRRNLAIGKDSAPKLGEPPIADPVKYEYISDKETATGILRAVTDMYQTEITSQTRGVVTNKATAIEALKMVSDGAIGEHVVGAAANAAEIYARAHLLRGATNHAFEKLNELARTPEAELTPAAKLQALASLERVSMLKAELEGVGAEAGRALQIFRAMKRDPSYLGEAETLLKLAERKGSLQDIAGMVSMLKDPAQLARFAKEYTSATTTEKVLEAWKAALLTGPQTHLANMLGNLTKWTVEIPESTLAATFYAASRAVKGDPLAFAQWKARAFSPLYGLQFGSKEALFTAAEVWRGTGERVEKADVYRTAIEGKAGEVVRLPFKALQVEDVLFRTVAERAQAHVMAVDRAIKDGFNPATAEFNRRVVEYTERPDFGLPEKVGTEALQRVQDAGAEAVFAQRLGPRMETVQRATAGHWSQFVIPFFRTPANLVSWAVQHVPGLNFMSARWREDFAAGGERQARALARVTIGTGLAMTAFSLAGEGVITGGGLFEPEERRTKSAAGWQPYSLLIDGKYYSYQRMEPVAKVLGIAADMYEMLASKKLDEGDSLKLMGMTVLMFGNATVSTTYLSGLSNTIQGVTDPDRYLPTLMNQYATSLVPKAIGQTAAALDPHKRQIDGVMDAIQSQIPILREKLLPKRDVWGEPTKNDKWFDVMPIQVSEASNDKVRTEAARLHIGLADAPRFAQERGPFNPSDKRVKLEPEQRDTIREVSGKNAMAILAPIVNAPDWQQIPDFAKIAIYKKVVEGARKQGEYAALPVDAEARQQLRQKILDRVIKETQAVSK